MHVSGQIRAQQLQLFVNQKLITDTRNLDGLSWMVTFPVFTFASHYSFNLST